METAKMKNNALLKNILAAAANKPETVPAGFKTSAQYADEWGLRASRTRALLNAGVRDGIVEVRNFRVASVLGGRVYPVPHFRHKKA
jgi:hypothetical protein